MSEVSVIGLGAMGSALAAAFLAKGHSVTVWNRTPEKAAALAARSATQATTITEAVAASRLSVACLLTYDTVYEALAPAEQALSGHVLVNLTNGTPAQARKMAAWAAERGAEYLDGGIMAIPPMIGQQGALVLYSGSQHVFDEYQPLLENLGVARYLGDDAGLAALHDLALLSGMYGMFAGVIHATALVGTERVSARRFMPMLVDWLNAMMEALPGLAEQVDTKDYTSNVVSNMAMQAAAYPNLIEASRDQEVSTELVEPMGALMRKAVAAGFGDADIGSLVELIRKRSA